MKKADVLYCLAIGFFFVGYVFTIARQKSNFFYFDEHYFVIILSLFVSLSLVNSLISDCKWALSVSRLSICLKIFVLYVTARMLTDFSVNNSTIPYVWLALATLVSMEQFFRNLKDWSILLILYNFGMLIQGILVLVNVYYPAILFHTSQHQVNTGVTGMYFAISAPFSIASWYYFNQVPKAFSKLYKLISLCGICISSYIVVDSNSRISWISATIAVSLILNDEYRIYFNVRKSIKRSNKKVIFLICSITMLILLGVALYFHKPGSALGRLLIYSISLDLFKMHPIFGLGLDGFKAKYNVYQSEYLSNYNIPNTFFLLADNVDYTFNEFLQIAIELGLVGLLMLLISIFCIYKILAKRISETRKDYIAIGASASLLSAVICSQASYPFHVWSILMIVIFFLAITSSLDTHVIKINLNNSILKSGGVLLCIFLVCFEIARIKNLGTWRTAANLSLSGNFEPAQKLYTEIMRDLQHDGRFLFNYGAELNVHGHYRCSVSVLERATKFASFSSLYLYLGNSYENLNRLNEAEGNYQLASRISPSKFIPRFHLLNFYLRTKNNIKAVNTAKAILGLTVKVPSKEVDDIKFFAVTTLDSLSSSVTK